MQRIFQGQELINLKWICHKQELIHHRNGNQVELQDFQEQVDKLTLIHQQLGKVII